LLEPSKPVGTKDAGALLYRRGGFGRKGGMMLARCLRQAQWDTPEQGKDGKGVFECHRVPLPEFREETLSLITSSFAEGLEPMISMAIDAAYISSSSESTSRAPMIYEDVQMPGVYADLSSCQLWTRAVHRRFQDEFQSSCSNRLVCAVLWRLLEAPTTIQDAEQIPLGPVLEVLFLATNPDLREMCQAQELVKELEETAISMGCYAVCVAAVPKQGVSFWSRCGYEVVVPLESPPQEQPSISEAEAHVPNLGEPCNDLGAFLLQKMLLFTDTPLVAKVLRPHS